MAIITVVTRLNANLQLKIRVLKRLISNQQTDRAYLNGSLSVAALKLDAT